MRTTTNLLISVLVLLPVAVGCASVPAERPTASIASALPAPDLPALSAQDQATTFTLNSESTYDWEESELAAPVNAVVSQVLKLGGQLVSVGGGLRYWVEESDTSPEGLGFRFFVTLLFPK